MQRKLVRTCTFSTFLPLVLSFFIAVDYVRYNYNDSTIWIVNSLYTTQSNFLATVKVVNFDATVMLEKNISIGTVLPDSSQSIMALPSIGGLSSTYFLKLSLR